MADFPDSTPVTEIPRQVVEAEIELLISLLDILDPESDLEDNADYEFTGDDEPNLGAPNQQAGSWTTGPFPDHRAEIKRSLCAGTGT